MQDERVNPFERHLLDRLHQPCWSPSVLSTSRDRGSALMETPPQTSWGIHQMSLLNPIQIEESPSTHQNETVLDPESEANAQAAIKKFFSSTEPIAPSPISSRTPNSTNNKSTNTELSFPPTLPPDFEQFLYSYNALNTSGTRNEELNSSLTRRKLDFTFESVGDTDMSDIDIDIDDLNGRTINSPEENTRTNLSEKRFGRSAFIRSEDFGVDMASPASTPIRG